MVGPAARRRVEGCAPSLASALEMNREALARDQRSRRAIAVQRLADARAAASAKDGESVFFRLVGTSSSSEAVAAAEASLRAVAAEQEATAVEPWRAEAVADLAAQLLAPDSRARASARGALDHKALRTGLLASIL